MRDQNEPREYERPEFDSKHNLVKAIQKLREDHTDLEKKHLEMRAALIGDLNGKPGALQQLVRVMETIYNPHEGLEVRVNRHDQIKWYVLGGIAVAGFVLTAAWKLLEVYGHH